MSKCGHPKFIERLRELMAEEGLTPAELNKRARLSRTTVGDILRSPDDPKFVRSPKLDTLEKLAAALKVSVSYLIGETDIRGEELALLRDWQAMHPDDRAALRQLAASKAAAQRVAS